MKNLFEVYNKQYEFIETQTTVAHMGRSVLVSHFTYENKGRGNKSAEIRNVEAFLEAYNASLVADAKSTIENQIAAEKEAANAKERALLDKIAELENGKITEAEKKANAIQRRKDITTKSVVSIGLIFMLLVMAVGSYMNIHNLTLLFGKIIPQFGIVIFAVVISFIMGIFAYMQSKKHTIITSFVLPIDFIIAIGLHLYFTDEFKTNNPMMVKHFLMGFGVFYAAQIFVTLNELKKIMLNAELRTKFFDVLFLKW